MNGSRWTCYKSEAPCGLAVVNTIVCFGILTTNILILVTFKQMKKVSLLYHLMICLAVVDILTVPPHTPTMITLWRGSLCLTETFTNLLPIDDHTSVSATTWLHCAICIEKCCLSSQTFCSKIQTFLRRYCCGYNRDHCHCNYYGCLRFQWLL